MRRSKKDLSKKKVLKKNINFKPLFLLGIFSCAGALFFTYFNLINRSTVDLYSSVSSKYQLSHELFPNIRQISNYKHTEFQQLAKVVYEKPGTYGVYVKDLKTSQVYAINEEYNFFSASLFKVPIAVAMLKEMESGNIKLDQEVVYTENDFTDGSGVLNQNEFDTVLTMNEVFTQLLFSSDNVAQNILTRSISGSSIAEAFDMSGDKRFYSENTVSPLVMGTYFEKITHYDYLQPNSINFLISNMTKTSFDDRISIHLKPTLSFAHKIGNWPLTGTWHDCGIVYDRNGNNIIVCLMSENTTYEDFLDIGRELAEFINKIT
jgi:beta-lactamase class A